MHFWGFITRFRLLKPWICSAQPTSEIAMPWDQGVGRVTFPVFKPLNSLGFTSRSSCPEITWLTTGQRALSVVVLFLEKAVLCEHLRLLGIRANYRELGKSCNTKLFIHPFLCNLSMHTHALQLLPSQGPRFWEQKEDAFSKYKVNAPLLGAGGWDVMKIVLCSGLGLPSPCMPKQSAENLRIWAGEEVTASCCLLLLLGYPIFGL